MSRSAIAEFPAKVICKSRDHDGPLDVRIALDRTHLSITNDDLTLSARLSSVFDVKRGPPPVAAERVFGGPIVTVAFHQGLASEVVLIGGDPAHLERFSDLLFRSILDDSEVILRHPVEIAGRATGAAATPGAVKVGDRAVEFVEIDMPFRIDLESVIFFAKRRRELLGDQFDVIAIESIRNGSAIISEIAIGPARKFNLLARYLRTEYDEVRRSLDRIELSEKSIDVLRRLERVGGQASVRTFLDDRERSSIQSLGELREQGLIEGTEGRVRLTSRGWIYVTDTLGSAMH